MKNICFSLSILFLLNLFAADWKNSTFWSADSETPIPGEKVLRLIRLDDGLAVAGNRGLNYYKLENGKYTLAGKKNFRKLHTATRLGKNIIAITSDGFQIWNLENGTLKNSRKAAIISGNISLAYGAVTTKMDKSATTSVSTSVTTALITLEKICSSALAGKLNVKYPSDVKIFLW